jgi:hypothetical protein
MPRENNSKGFWKDLFLRTWHPIPTVKSTILLFTILGIIFIIFGVVLITINASIIEIQTEYDNLTQCPLYTNCTISFTLEKDMTAPIFVFYELHNFYQNHRRYIRSKSATQLAGTVISSSDASSSCDPVYLMQHIGKNTSYGGAALADDAVANPCGLIAKSVFNDSYFGLTSISDGNLHNISEDGISWPNDVGKKFKRCPNSDQVQWIDPENEHFVVWMRTAGLPNFRKLWGKIESDLIAGDYTVNITNNYDVNSFAGNKYFVLSTSGAFGGKNPFLAIAYCVIGGICLLIAIIFFAKFKFRAAENKAR